MSERRIIEMYYDVNAQVLRNSPSGEEVRIALLPYISFREKVIVNLQLVIDSDLSPFTELDEGGLQFEASVDKTFMSGSLMCKTLDSGINQEGDWTVTSDDTADPSQGQISIRLNANTSSFQSRIGTLAELPSTQMELQVKDSEDNVVFNFRMPLRCLGVLNDSGLVPTELSDNFQWFTDPVTGKQCLRLVNDDGEVLEVFRPMGV